MARILMFVIPVALAIYATIDCARTPKDEMPAGIPKALALFGIIVFTVVGPLAWIVVSRVMRAEQRGGIQGGLWSSENPQPLFQRHNKKVDEPLPPDDDPDFLWKLEAEIKRQKLAEEAEEEKRQQREERLRRLQEGGAESGTDRDNSGDDHDSDNQRSTDERDPDDSNDSPYSQQ